MIILNIKGGLGNQLFQYAAARAILEKNSDKELYFDLCELGKWHGNTPPRTFDLGDFCIIGTEADAGLVQHLREPNGLFSKLTNAFTKKILQRHNVGFVKNITQISGDQYLDGYFQSPLYFQGHELTLRKELRLKAPSIMFTTWSKKIDSHQKSCSLHLRFGDYTGHSEFGGIVDNAYYQNAISLVRNNSPHCHFFIFSDDIELARKTFQNLDETTFVDGALSAAEEITLMSYCTHHIIANSSFSWWGAWLDERTDNLRIAPKRWSKHHDKDWYNTIIPNSWTRL